MSTLMTIHRLHKHFAARRLLEIESIQLLPGHLYVLTGDNGSGKTTLLRCLAGLEPADAMQLEFAGQAMQGSAYPPAWRQEIIYVHQHPYLFNTSIADNIAYGLRMRGLPTDVRAAQVAEAIVWAGLIERQAVPPKRLSGGEKQKVALARAKVLNPRLLLVDEPTANLDRDARAQIRDLLMATASTNNCVVMACHDQELIDLPGVVRLQLEDGRLTEGISSLHNISC